MRHAARPEDRVARAQEVPHVAHLHDELAVERIEPLVLREVQVARRTTGSMEGVLEHQETRSDHLESDGAHAEAVALPRQILSDPDDAGCGVLAHGFGSSKLPVRSGPSGT